MPPPAQQTIDEVLDRFLAEQRERLSPRTFSHYAEVIELLRHSLDGYAYSSLDDDERARWEKAFESHEERAFCRLFGPEKIPEHLGEFLGYFMVRKVIAGQELLKAAGTVTGKLVRWLEHGGYIDAGSADDASERARDGARDLPLADRLGSASRPEARPTRARVYLCVVRVRGAPRYSASESRIGYCCPGLTGSVATVASVGSVRA